MTSLRRLAAFAVVLAVLPAAVLLLFARAGFAAAPGTISSVPPEVVRWGFLAAAISTGLSAIGSAVAVAVVGGAAMGAVAEKPELAGRALVFVGLAEGIAIYGLIVAIMILGRLG
ncbi:MAG TPA: ATP synthase subunit C [Myxococcales bacterium]|nr:ATP synthase subunit C [Myxococcales bacterium]